MKQKKYTDGSPSREIEEDWEATGQDEMNNLFEDEKEKKSILDIRDMIARLKTLITVTREALGESKLYDIKPMIVDVLYFYIEKEINEIDQELQKQ